MSRTPGLALTFSIRGIEDALNMVLGHFAGGTRHRSLRLCDDSRWGHKSVVLMRRCILHCLHHGILPNQGRRQRGESHRWVGTANERCLGHGGAAQWSTCEKVVQWRIRKVVQWWWCWKVNKNIKLPRGKVFISETKSKVPKLKGCLPRTSVQDWVRREDWIFRGRDRVHCLFSGSHLGWVEIVDCL